MGRGVGGQHPFIIVCDNVVPDTTPVGLEANSPLKRGHEGTLDPSPNLRYNEQKGGETMDEKMMQEALALAREAANEGEVPVGCVITLGDRIVGRGRNRREVGKNALAHAEIEAIHDACRTLGGWRLWRCTLYVTLEPCPMCAGAIINARIPRVVFGGRDEKFGSVGSVVDLFSLPYNHKPEVVSGVLEAEAIELLQEFFQSLRTRRKKKKSDFILE